MIFPKVSYVYICSLHVMNSKQIVGLTSFQRQNGVNKHVDSEYNDRRDVAVQRLLFEGGALNTNEQRSISCLCERVFRRKATGRARLIYSRIYKRKLFFAKYF